MPAKPGKGGQKKRRSAKGKRPLRPGNRARPAAKIRADRGVEKREESAAADPREPGSGDDKVQGIRLQKLLADRGYGSRRKMEAWITEGKVEVNGQAAQLGQRVTRQDVVRVNGRPLREKARLPNARVLMYNKPEGEIVSMNDPRRRPTVFRNLPRIRGARWVAIGRLDINTSGLLLFTTSGELANRLMHPSSGIEREYRCRIFGSITPEAIAQLLNGIQIERHLMKFNKVVVEDQEGDQRNKWVHVTLEEGRNREVRKLWEAVGCQVSRLTRVRYGFLTLPRNLRQGKYRELTEKEIRRLSSE